MYSSSDKDKNVEAPNNSLKGLKKFKPCLSTKLEANMRTFNGNLSSDMDKNFKS